MPVDRKRIYIFSASTLAALLLCLLAPAGSGRIIAALLLLPMAAVALLLIKKRAIPSIFSPQVLLIMGASGVMYFVLYYISALHFGFSKTGYGLKLDIIFRLVLPIGIIIAATELIRFVLCSQKRRGADALAYFICLASEIIICAGTVRITSYATLMDVIGLTLAPGIAYNFLYGYVSKRYGFLPNLIYRAMTVWVFYLIPYGSLIPDSLTAFINLLIPIGLYAFIDSLYERKKRYALGSGNRLTRAASVAITALVLVLMTCTVMLISNQFRYGARVIATESMTGELNKGDVAIIERYDGQAVKPGQVIAFEKDGSVFVHRVISVEIINGSARYCTAGDANEDPDAGYITSGQIIGLVDTKIAYVGYPTLWLRSLFSGNKN